MEIKKTITIDSLEFLIDEDYADTQHDYIEEIKCAIKALIEYRTIGTVEEFRKLVQEQKSDIHQGYNAGLSDAIEIVKAGGKNDD